MQKVKYVIIFTLLVALGLLYIQLDDYDKISNSLLQENISSNDEIKTLNEKVQDLQSENELLQNKVYSLEQQLLEQERNITLSKLDDNYSIDNTLDLNNSIEQEINDTQTIRSDEINIQPKITLDNENKITGFEQQNKEDF